VNEADTPAAWSLRTRLVTGGDDVGIGLRGPLQRRPSLSLRPLASVGPRPRPVQLRHAHPIDRLPAIPVPLRAPAPDAWLDLQEVLDHGDDTGGYADSSDDGEPGPHGRPDDVAWARALVPQPR